MSLFFLQTYMGYHYNSAGNYLAETCNLGYNTSNDQLWMYDNENTFADGYVKRLFKKPKEFPVKVGAIISSLTFWKMGSI